MPRKTGSKSSGTAGNTTASQTASVTASDIEIPAWLRKVDKILVNNNVIGCTIDDMLYDLSQGPFVCGDIETTGTDIIDDQIVSLQFCSKPTKAWFIPVAMLGMDNLPMPYLAQKLKPLWEKGLVLHGSSFDWQFLQRSVDFEILADTLVEAKCLPDLWISPRDFSLKGLVRHLFKLDTIEFKKLFPKGTKDHAKRFDLVDHGIAVAYGCQDPIGSFMLHEYFQRIVDSTSFIYQLEHQVLKPIARMELLGIGLNTPLLVQAEIEAQAALDELTRSIYQHAGHEFLITSTQQLAKVLFDELGLLPPKLGDRSTAIEVLNELQGEHPIIEDVQDFRGISKLKEAFIDTLPQTISSDGNVHCSVNNWGAITGRTSCSQPNLQQIPKPKGKTGDKFRVLLRQAFIPPVGYGSLLDQDYCVAPSTRVLKTDLTWVTAESVSVGDELIGFDEELRTQDNSRGNQFRPTKVECTKRLTKPCYRVTTDRGSVVSSDTHLWCARHKKGSFLGNREWIETQKLKPGDAISFLAEPWEVEDTYEAGYLAGFLDGEGYVSETIIGFGQNPGPTGDRVVQLLADRGFSAVTKHTSTPNTECRKYHIPGGLGTTLRLLGQLRPKRLLAKSRLTWEGRQTWGKRSCPAVVTSVEFLGEQEVVAIQTTEHTFIAEGFLSHNCQLEYRLFASFSGDPTLLEAFWNGEDVHRRTAAIMFGVPYEAVTKLQRERGKTCNFASIYGQGAKSLAKQWGIPVYKAQDTLDNYWARMPKAATYVAQLKRFAKDNLYCETHFGRRRALPYANSSIPHIREATARESVNTPPQGTGGDLIKMAIVRADKYLVGFKSRLSLTVHDQLVTAIHPDDNPLEIAEIVREAMEISIDGFVPLLTEAKHGLNWYDTTELTYTRHTISPVDNHTISSGLPAVDVPVHADTPGVLPSEPRVGLKLVVDEPDDDTPSTPVAPSEPDGQYRIPGLDGPALDPELPAGEGVLLRPTGSEKAAHPAKELWLTVDGHGPQLDCAMTLLIASPGPVAVHVPWEGQTKDTGIRTTIIPETLFKLRQYQVGFTMSGALKTALRAQVGAA